MKKIISIILPVLGLMSVSCSYLDTIPGDSLTGEHFWLTADDDALQQYCRTYYPRVIKGHGNPNGWDCGDMFKEEYKSDNIYPGSQNKFSYGHNILRNSDEQWNWEVIRACNTFIENYQKSPASKAGKDFAAGQMYFFKAWDYFNKVVLYGDVPWYDKGSDKTDPSLYKGRDSRVLVVDNIIKTLDKAIELLPKKELTYYVSKDAAIMLKARVCLFEGTWRKYHLDNDRKPYPTENYERLLKLAYDSACELMSPQYGYSLYTEGGPDEAYFNLFCQDQYEGNPEIILSRQYDAHVNMGHSIHLQLSNTAHGMSRDAYEEYLCSKTGKPISMCGCHDYHDGYVKECENRDLRLVQTICVPDAESKYHHYLFLEMNESGKLVMRGGAPNIQGQLRQNAETNKYFFGNTSTGYALCKHFSMEDYLLNEKQKGKTDCPVMRYGEVLLIRAEAAAELGTITQDDLDLTVNKLRERVGFPFPLTMSPYHDEDLAKKYPNVKGENPDLIREIRRERRVELFAEGYRWQDLLRWKVAENILNERPRKGAWLDPALYTPEDFEIVKKSIGLDSDGFVLPYEVKGQLDPKFSERNYLLNIPLDQIALNPKLLPQNPGWEQ